MQQKQNNQIIKQDWKKNLVRQATLHLSMEPQDVYKLLFQAAFGAEHLLLDKEAAHTYFQKEYEEVAAEGNTLYEPISETVYRVNLGAWKRQNLPSEWLFQMFAGSVETQAETEESESRQQIFSQYVEMATEVVREGTFSFSFEDFLQYAKTYEQEGIRPVHHSERYRKNECPSYRLVNAQFIRVVPILQAAAAIFNAADRNPETSYIIAIDGRCASGKSTMARMLHEITGAGVVHMDDFFLPMELRTEERLAQPGGNVHYERFREEVLSRLKGQDGFAYRRFDCGRMELGEKQVVADSPLRVVEGAYSCHPVFGDYADLRIFSDVEAGEQLRRIGQRDGGEMLPMFRERWIPMEENYFAAYATKEKADIIV